MSLWYTDNVLGVVLVTRDEEFMSEALLEAKAAGELGEVPIGAVIVHNGEIIARGHNYKEIWHDATAHAEMVAIWRASARLGRWRLTGTTLYVTIEPCPMCAGALVMARVDRLVYGALDPKAGAVDSLVDLVRDPRLNHQMEVVGGVLAEESAQLIKGFFRRLRQNGSAERCPSG